MTEDEDRPTLEELAEKCDYETKLAVTAWVFKHIVEHANSGGSYRYLIYHRLGFGMDAYVPLCSDGLDISNNFDMESQNNIKEKIREHKLEVMKSAVNFCDEPGCFKDASCGFPTDTGYRHTCYDHSKFKKDNI